MLTVFCSLLLHRFVLVSSAVVLVDATPPTTTIEGRLEFPDKKPFNITTRITLNNQQYTTYSRSDGSFSIFNVPPGIHQIDIHSNTYHFGLIKIQLLEESMDSPSCLEYAYPGALKQTIKYPLVLNPHAKYDYFEKRRGFNLFVILKNPMVLMMGFGAILMFLMPKMMEGLSEEEKLQLRQQQQAQGDPTQMLSKMFGDITGTGGNEDSAAASRSARRAARNKRD